MKGFRHFEYTKLAGSRPVVYAQNHKFAELMKIRTELFARNIVVKPTLPDMGILKQVAEYLYLRKKDPNSPNTQWVKYMHGINRISIFLFLIALIIIFVKLVVLKKH